MSKFRKGILSITQQSWVMFKRMFARSVALVMLTMVGCALLDFLVDSGATDRYALIRRFPEFIPLLMASITLTFIEMSVFWVRFSTQPVAFDLHTALTRITADPWDKDRAIVALYAISTLQWAFRVGLLVYLSR